MRYRKKPVEVEAVLWTGDNLEQVNDFVKDEFYWDVNAQAIRVSTLEGEMTASVGDYIIRGIQGEFYPCKPDIFEKTYDRVEDEQ